MCADGSWVAGEAGGLEGDGRSTRGSCNRRQLIPHQVSTSRVLERAFIIIAEKYN